MTANVIARDDNSQLLAENFLNGISSGFIGYLAGKVLRIIHPVGGMIFGVSSALLSYPAAFFLARIFKGSSEDEANARFIGYYLSKFIGAWIVTVSAGYALTLMGGIALGAGIVAAEMVVKTVFFNK